MYQTTRKNGKLFPQQNPRRRKNGGGNEPPVHLPEEKTLGPCLPRCFIVV
jgi:hypothetical protein